ncbi:MAG TPA: hypothetical protein VKK81_14160 [Candidatus Binatia bacterium]|nr:hypothetical protein [Candidatus Binatia bacterium]
MSSRWGRLVSATGNAAPIGTGLTVAAYHWFTPVYMVTDPFSGKREYDDMEAVLGFAQAVLSNFRLAFAEEEWTERLKVELSIAPYSDLFEKMTNKQIADFKAKLEKLLKALEEAKAEADPVEACKILRRQFGDDFPVPPKEETGRRTPPAIISSSSST